MEYYASLKKNKECCIVIWNHFQNKLLTEKYMVQILLVSGPAYNDLGSCHFILTINKNLNKLKNQQLFLGLSKKWSHKAHCCPQNWRHRQVDTENYNLLEQKLPWETAPGRKTWTVIEKLLEAQCRQTWERKSPWEPSIHNWIHCCSYCLEQTYL